MSNQMSYEMSNEAAGHTTKSVYTKSTNPYNLYCNLISFKRIIKNKL